MTLKISLTNPSKDRRLTKNIVVIDPGQTAGSPWIVATSLEEEQTIETLKKFEALKKLKDIVEGKVEVCLIFAAPLSFNSRITKPYPRTFVDFNDFFLSEMTERGERAGYLQAGIISAQRAESFFKDLVVLLSKDCEFSVVEGVPLDPPGEEVYSSPQSIAERLLKSFLDGEKYYWSEVDSSFLETYQKNYIPLVMPVYLSK